MLLDIGQIDNTNKAHLDMYLKQYFYWSISLVKKNESLSYQGMAIFVIIQQYKLKKYHL